MGRRFAVIGVWALLSLTLLVSPAFSGGQTKSTTATVTTINRDLTEALALIEEKFAGPVSHQKAVDNAIQSMLQALDPHSAYYNREAFEEFRTEQQSQYFGIGTVLGFRNNGSYITAPGKGTPAFQAGLKYGDEIIEVNGVSISQIPYGQVSRHVRGPRGTTVEIKVRRAGLTEPVKVRIVRDAVPQPSIPYSFMLSPSVGYIAITEGFHTTTGDEMEVALQRLKTQGLQELVLDLRSNRGGLTSEAIRVVNHFLKSGETIFSQRGRARGMSEDFPAYNRKPEKLTLVVLIDRSSASASEIVAGAIQDHDRGLVVGEESFGKGLVQSIISSDPGLYGGALILTTAKYYTPSGRLIQREYQGLSNYDYLASHRNGAAAPSGTGTKHQTDSGRAVFGGRGITPDVVVKPRFLTAVEVRLLDPIFGFAREVVAGQVKGLESYKVESLQHDHVLKETDYPVTNEVVAAFRAYLKQNPEFKVTDAVFEQNLAYLKNRLRAEFVTAAYGNAASYQVTVTEDVQVQKAIENLPRAKQLAEQARKSQQAKGVKASE